MSVIDWYVEGPSYGSCNCDWSCPCQFEALPTEGNCRGFEAFRVDKGHFGDVRLEGLKAVVLYAWPGPVFEGKGEMQLIIDENADQDQRGALAAICCGEHTNEAATHWWVFHAMSDTIHETLYQKIDLDVDIEARKAHLVVPGIVQSIGSPIRSPATGDEHRVRIDMPNGIEFTLAEIGNASSDVTGAITLNLENTYGQWNMLYQSGNGIVRQ